MHGWGGDRNSFLGLADFLKDKFRITLVDFYGFGNTPHPNCPLTVDDYVQGVLEIIEKYNMQKVALVCHSFGGRVGIKLAANYHFCVSKLILVDSAGLRPRRGIKYYFRVIIHKIFIKLHINHISGSEDYQKTSGAMRETFKNVVNEDLKRYLNKIKVPVLIFWGNKDRATPIYMAKKLYKKLQNSVLVVLHGCGHFAYIERHEQFCRIVRYFLSGGSDVLGNCSFSNVFGNNCTIKISLSKSK